MAETRRDGDGEGSKEGQKVKEKGDVERVTCVLHHERTTNVSILKMADGVRREQSNVISITPPAVGGAGGFRWTHRSRTLPLV